MTNQATQFIKAAFLLSFGGFFALYGANILDHVEWTKSGQFGIFCLGAEILFTGGLGFAYGIATAAKS